MVFTPCGHGNGAYRAIHLMTPRPNIGLGANDFCPITPRNESARWHTIWCADIFPHRRWLSARTRPTRSLISFLHCPSASVFMPIPSCVILQTSHWLVTGTEKQTFEIPKLSF